MKGHEWALLSSHGLVLCYIAMHPDATLREISLNLGITERRVIDLRNDLCRADLLMSQRRGRGNRYELNPSACFRHGLVAELPVRDFINLMLWRPAPGTRPRSEVKTVKPGRMTVSDEAKAEIAPKRKPQVRRSKARYGMKLTFGQ